tara:strand:- start:756 stop:1508 length:753 start_codon:yes stop_codon:yes gene_type:complete
MSKSFELHKMKDSSDSYVTKKNPLFNLPMRLIIVAKTGGGKSSLLGNLLLKDDGYKNDFLPENVFIFSGSLQGDVKMKVITRELDIEPENQFSDYNEEALEGIYDYLVNRFNDLTEQGVKDKQELNSLIVLDDLAYSNALKNNSKDSQLRRIFFNGRKFSISIIIISQKYTSVSTPLRENLSGLIVGACSNKQMEVISADHNYLKSGYNGFRKMFLEATQLPYHNLIINMDNDKEYMYYNNRFEPITEYE